MQPEAVADLDHLSAADHDLAAGGQRGGGEDERRGAVVHREHGSGVGHGVAEGGEGATSAARALAGDHVVLHVDVGTGGRHGVEGGGGQPGPAEVGVQHDAGGVDHRSKGRGTRRQAPHRSVRDLVGADLAGPGARLCRQHLRLDGGGDPVVGWRP